MKYKLQHKLTFHDLVALIDWEGNEQCGFLIGTPDCICDLWPTPSLRPSPLHYSIGRASHVAAQTRAKREGVRVLGTIHTHPNGPVGPSPLDLALARKLRDQIRAVWHPRSGTLTIYDRTGILLQEVIARPWWFRLIAPLFFV